MFEEMEEYLASTTTPERKDILTEAATLLTTAGVLSHHIDIERVLRMSDQFDIVDNIQDLFSILTKYMEDTLINFGVSVSDEVPLGCLNHVMTGLLTIPNYGDPEVLLDICHREDSPEDKFMDLLDEVTPMGWATFAPYIESVSKNFIERVILVVSENVLPEEERVDLSPYRERLKRHTAQQSDLIVSQVLREGIQLGSPVEKFLVESEEHLGLIEANPEQLARELVGLVLASDVADGELRELVGSLLEDYAKDINIVTKASVLATQHLAQAIEVKYD